MFNPPKVKSTIITEDSLKSLLYKLNVNDEVRNYVIRKILTEYDTVSEMVFVSLYGLYTNSQVDISVTSNGIRFLNEQYLTMSQSEREVLAVSETYSCMFPYENLFHNFDYLIEGLGIFDYNDNSFQTRSFINHYVMQVGYMLGLHTLQNGMSLYPNESIIPPPRILFHIALGKGFIIVTAIEDDSKDVTPTVY